MKINKFILFLLGILLISGGYLYFQSETINPQDINNVENVSIPTSVPNKPIKDVLGETANKENLENVHPICNDTKQEVLNDAFSEGVTDVNELKKLAATYDLLCFGETDVEIPESEQATVTNESFSESCQEDREQYNSCLIEYNAELLEWQNCQSGEQTFGCPLSSMKPTNTCKSEVSFLCRSAVLGN